MKPMRVPFVLATLVLSLALAGCGGNSDDSASSTTSGQCLSTEDDGSAACTTTSTSTTPPAPNVPPVLTYAITVGAVATNVTTVGTNVTIEATGSSDPDGDGLSVIVAGAEDSNQTYLPQFLYFDGEFAKATFQFKTPGVVNITIAAVDKRNDSTVAHTNVFVNEQSIVSNIQAMPLVAPTQSQAPQPTTCKGPTAGAAAAIDTASSYQGTFRVAAGAKYVVAKVTGGTANIALCDSAGVAISSASGTGTEVTSTKGTVFTVPTGTASYFVEVYNTKANTAVGENKVEVTVHYEPQP